MEYKGFTIQENKMKYSAAYIDTPENRELLKDLAL